MKNQIFLGDCFDILDNLTNSVDVIYLDPPFFTQTTQKQKTRDNTKEFFFCDNWKSLDEYLAFMRERFKKMHNALKSSGSIFVHCDSNASHYLRLLLDQTFSYDHFINEIIWTYRRWSNTTNSLLNAHQTIFWYSKTNKHSFNTIYQEYSPATNIDQIVQKRTRNLHGKSAYKKDDEGNSILIEDKKGVPLNDVWDIPYLNPKARERVGWPTQKPLALVERLISISSNKNDIILDPFCGSGTTLVAAKLLGRNYIGIDISNQAIDLAKQRIENPIKSESKLLQIGRESYRQQDASIENNLKGIGAIPVQRNKGIDGLLSSEFGLVPIRYQREHETIDMAVSAIEKASIRNQYRYKVVIKNNPNEKFLPSINGVFVVQNSNIVETLKKTIEYSRKSVVKTTENSEIQF